MAAKKQWYAIKKGQNPENGEAVHNQLVKTWAEAYRLVHGAPGAEYAGFVHREEAESYLCGSTPHAPARATRFAKPGKKEMKMAPADMPADTLCCYVDGSFNDTIPNYGFGLVCIINGHIVHSASGAGTNPEAVSMRQIAGELLGAMHALRYARQHDHRKVLILHDYVGVAHHATGAWKRTNPFSVIYHDWMQTFFRENPNVSVSFHKVAAHAGDWYNELADVLAKRSVNMVPDPIWLQRAIEAGVVQKDNV